MKGGHVFSGPAPLSAAARAVRGSKERPRHRRTVVAAIPGRPAKPRAVFGRDGAREWARLAELLEQEGRLTLSDGPTLTLAAVAFDHALQLRRSSPTLSLVVFRAERQWWTLYEKALGDLCLLPATRSRAPAPIVAAIPNALDRFRERNSVEKFRATKPGGAA
jgi:hypothetical protein